MAKKRGKPKKKGRKPIYEPGKSHNDYFKNVHISNLTKRKLDKTKRKGETYADQLGLALDVVEHVGINQLGMTEKHIHPGDVLDELHKRERTKKMAEEIG